jgi:hypothetical protein
MESSLVSIPANAGAIVMDWEKNKFTTPLIKAMGQGLFRARKPIVKGADMVAKFATDTGSNQSTGDSTTSKDSAAGAVDTTKTASTQNDQKSTPSKKKDEMVDGQSSDDPGLGTTVEATDEGAGSTGGTAADAQGTVASIVDRVNAASTGETVPSECKGRLTLIASMLTDFSTSLDQCMADIAAAAQSKNVFDVYAAMPMLATCAEMLPSIIEEFGRAAMVDGVDDATASEIAACATMVQELSNLMSPTDGDVPMADGDGDQAAAANSDQEPNESGDPKANDDEESKFIELMNQQ